MSSQERRWPLTLALGLVASSGGTSAFAASHLWVVNEVFSNADGTIQFIELWECCGSSAEIFIGGKKLTSDVNGSVFVIIGNLAGSTANRHLLFATQSFARLPGAPTPDFIIPDRFFAVEGDKIWYGPVENYDSFTFERGDLPSDGLNSIHVTDFVSDTFTTDVNSPTNFADQAGSVDVAAIPVASTWGLIVLSLLLVTGASIRSTRRDRGAATSSG